MKYTITDLTKEEYCACEIFLEEERKKKKREKAIKECRDYLREIIVADIDAIGFDKTYEILNDLLCEIEDVADQY